MRKKMSLKLIIAYILLVIVVAFGGMLLLRGKDHSNKAFALSLKENKNATYQSKLEAYKAKKEADRRGNLTLNTSSAYSNIDDARDTIKSDNREEIVRESDVGLETKIAQARARNNERSKTFYNEAPKINDKDYSELEADVKNYYSNTKETEKVAQLTEREKRKKAMEESWNQVTTNNAQQGRVAENTKGFKAVVHGNQIVQRGGSVLLRVMEDIKINDYAIPRNTLVAGVMTMNENRMSVNIRSVRIGNDIIPLAFKIYGTDGIEGISIDVNAVGSSIEKTSSQGALNEVANVVSSAGGVLGRVAGSVVRGAGSTSQQQKSKDIELLDNQMVILKPI